MKIGILGTRGVPNHYGGFEQFAAYLSRFLVENDHEVIVYSSSLHPYQEKTWEGVRLVHCKDWEDKIGTAGQFIYDLNCILNARKQNFDVLLQLGYTSSSIWAFLLPKTIVVTNMDGLEWKRSKFSKKVQYFLRKAEKWAVKSSTVLVADSTGIQAYLKEERGVDSHFIAYGADEFTNPNEQVLEKYDIKPHQYNMLVARMEPENNIEVILEGIAESNNQEPFLVIGKTENEFGQKMLNKFKEVSNIRFLGGIYDLEALDNLRYFCKRYFHGHSVGGTNPSLLEAMASSAFIIAHQNVFNEAVLGKDAFYFNSSAEIKDLLNKDVNTAFKETAITNNLEKIRGPYSWSNILNSYLHLFTNLAQSQKNS